MAELKTQPTDQDVQSFLQSIPDEKRRRDSQVIAEMMRSITGKEPRMWGEAMVGYGDHHYRYATGREGDWFCVGFSPRKQNLTVYLTYGFEKDQELMQRLGKVKTGKACLYINKLEDIDQQALKELIEKSYASYK